MQKKTYIHYWRHVDDEVFVHEQVPSIGHKAAIEAYWQQEQEFFTYHHTLALDPNNNTWSYVDIKDLIEWLDREEARQQVEEARYQEHVARFWKADKGVDHVRG